MILRGVLFNLSAFLLILVLNSPGWTASPVEDLFREARQEGEFRLSSQEEVSQAEVLFSRILQGERVEQLAPAWQALGYQLLDLSQGGIPLVALMEDSQRKEGRGFFLFSRREGVRHLLMIPHGFKDLRTDTIGLALFLEQNFAVGAWNTVARYRNPEDTGREQDLGKQPLSYFTALTRAFAGYRTQDKVFQLHGFTQTKRESLVAREAGGILSGGSKDKRQDIQELRSCLQTIVHDPILLFPDEVRELGGTTNISGMILRTLGHNGFIHIELNRPLRERLNRDPALRKAFGNCLEESK